MSYHKYNDRLHKIAVGHLNLTRTLDRRFQGKALVEALKLNQIAINTGWDHIRETARICYLADKYLRTPPT